MNNTSTKTKVVQFKNQRREESEESENESDDCQIAHFTYFHCGECVCYFLSLLIFIGMIMGGRSYDANVYLASHAVNQQLIEFVKIDTINLNEQITFNSIISIDHLWFYLNNILVPTIINDNNGYLFNNHGILMGGVRIRQYRVKQQQCDYKGINFDCYSLSEYQSSLNLPNSNLELNWNSAKENNEAPILYGFRGKYPGSGYSVLLPRNQTESLNILQLLQNDSFIDGATRLISIDFNLFNPTSGMHTICRLLFEFGSDGACINESSFETIKLLRYENNYFPLIFDILFVISIILTTISEIKEMSCNPIKCKKYCDFWNVIDCITIINNWCIIAMLILQFNILKDMDLLSVDQYLSLLYIQYIINIKKHFLFFGGMLLFFRVFKYFEFSQRLAAVFHMLSYAALDILIFIFVIGICIFAFALGGFIMFGTNIIEFSTPLLAIFVMTRSVIVGLDYHYLSSNTTYQQWIFVSIYYVFWGLLVILILANVFIAILNESYSSIHSKFKKHYKVKQGIHDAINAAIVEIKTIRDKLIFHHNDTLSRKQMEKKLHQYDSKRNMRRGSILKIIENEEESKINLESDDMRSNDNYSEISVRKSLIALCENDDENNEMHQKDDMEPAIELSDTRQDYDLTIISQTPSYPESIDTFVVNSVESSQYTLTSSQ